MLHAWGRWEIDTKFRSDHLRGGDHLGDLGEDGGVDLGLPKYGVKAKTT
jgi:hypothetical protein